MHVIRRDDRADGWFEPTSFDKSASEHDLQPVHRAEKGADEKDDRDIPRGVLQLDGRHDLLGAGA
jgi:hypothetical protein